MTGARTKALIYGWGTVAVVYQLCGSLAIPARVLPLLLPDRLIPFSPLAVWPYLSFFLIIPLAYLQCPLSRLRWLCRSMQLTALAAGLVYWLYPVTMAYPPICGQGISEHVLRQLVRIDSPKNCLPSLHMALTLLAVLAMTHRQAVLKTVCYWLWGAVIAFSILQLRRHLFIDLVAGGILAILIGWGCYYGVLLQKKST